MKTWPHPRILLLSAAALFVAGIGLLYAGALKAAPVPLFAAVLLCVVAAVATTARDIQRLQTAHAPSAPPAASHAQAEPGAADAEDEAE